MQKNIVPFRVGTWLPSDQSILENWIEALISEVESHKKPFHPVLEELRTLLEVMPKSIHVPFFSSFSFNSIVV